MSCDQRLCLGVGGCRCGSFMSPLFRGPHPTCARCRGVRCTADVTCDICSDWSVAQWGAFLKLRPYSGHRKRRLSGSTLPPAPQTTPPSASFSLEASCPPPPPPPPRSLSPPSEGLDHSGGGGGGGGDVARMGSLEAPPTPLPSRWRVVRGRRHRCPGFWGHAGFGCLFPHGGWGSGIFALPGVACNC